MRDFLERYRARGEHTIRLQKKTKKPFTEDWPRNPPDEPDTFQAGENVGLADGAPIGDKFTVDFDFDWPEAREAARLVGLKTEFIYGRPSARGGRRGYLSDKAIKSHSFKHAGKEVLKVMGVGSQCMAPPSVHPNGEILAFEVEGDRAYYLTAALMNDARRIVAIAVLARFWPGPGARHAASVGLSGFLLKQAKLLSPEAEEIIKTAATIAHDPDVMDRLKTLRSTAANIDRDDLDTSLDGFDAEAVKTLRKLFGIKKARAAEGLLTYFPSEVFYRKDVRSDTFFMHGGRALSVLQEGGDWLRDQYFLATDKSLRDSDVKEALATIHARARHGAACEVFTRCAFVDRIVYLDPCWATDEVIRVQASGWDVIACPTDVKFTRPSSMQALPDPRNVPPNSQALRGLFNLSDPEYDLLIGAITTNLFGFPRVAIVIIGERGTIKTAMNKYGRRLLDPSSLNGTLPKDTRSLAAVLRSTWSAHFANLSTIDHAVSDSFCRLLDGEAVSLPTLYETAALTVVPAQGPLFLDAIGDIIREGDLNDRCLIFHPEVMKRAYLSDDEVDAQFAAGHAAQLASILEQAVQALGREPSLTLTNLPRRARFARWLAALRPALLDLYRDRLTDQRDRQTEIDDVAAAIRTMVHGSWKGLVSDLFKLLTPMWPDRAPKNWPATKNQFGERLRKAAPGLRGIGWTVNVKHSNKGSVVDLQAPSHTVPPYVVTTVTTSDDGVVTA
jgi:hypothetical protein